MAAERTIATPDDARAVLLEIGAPERLVRHGELVLEAADALLDQLRALRVELNEPLVRAGAMLHDSGKTLFPAELAGKGSEHEEAGYALLREHGVDPAVARCCVSHAKWASMSCSLEELVVALADALWKGVRRAELEHRVVTDVAFHLRVDPWTVFVKLDGCFERIADGGEDRLLRSR